MFTAQVLRTPHAVALVGNEATYSYRQLDRLTDTVASRLRAAGVRPETVVGCWSHDSVTTVIQVLSVLKAGGAYLLLDPQLPPDRLRYMVADADPICLVGDQRPPDAISSGRSWLPMNEAAAQSVSTVETARVGPHNLAYVAYTSGSTGRPKGVLITHAAVANHARVFRAQFSLRPGDRLPLMAPIAFDMATEEMLPPLVSGCTLLEMADRLPTMETFTREVIVNGYTILNLPAPLWHHWTTHLRESDSALPAALRLVIAGSDKIYTTKLQEWMTLRGAERVWWVAAYGVTEATVTSLLYLTAAQDDLSGEALVPIGTPLENVSAVVSVDGELLLGGAGLARGYRNLPAKTSECFVDDGTGTRVYRTGDLVRQRPDGTFVWLGRQDSQIKINGLRIEPAEIEAMIQEFPAVGEAIVVFREPADPGDKGSLVAYLEARPGHRIDTGEVSSFLRDHLHPLMVPEQLVVLGRIPVNANGKLDRKALQLQTCEEAQTFQQVS